MVHSALSSNTLTGGRSAGSPSGVPLSAQAAIIATCSSLREVSCLYCWMPMFFSTYQGGMAPARSRIAVRSLILRANRRVSSYVTSDMGATPTGLWQFWQLRCRIGAMSLLNVTSSGLKATSEVEAKSCAPSANGTIRRRAAGSIRIRPIVTFHSFFVP